MEVMDFQSRYSKLNENQRRAVDTIDGPVMVIAGPGTGKTELLSMRAANILKKTDVLPENILCLTFTDSGAHAMRERLSEIIGKDAYKVAIHTFHSFGSEIINQNGEYFYHGANFRPADELATHEIIHSIFDSLEYSNPLASKMNGNYTYIQDATAAISDLKGSGLTSDELLHILDTNDATLDAIERDIATVFAQRISKNTVNQLIPILDILSSLEIPILPSGITPLVTTLRLSLSHTIDEAQESNSTKPITAWKAKWLTKDANNSFIFKDRARHDKLRSLSYVYFQYLAKMQESELYDFSDMILRVVHALEVFDELRFNLQEKYQYIMVDEFQDTNLAQMRILSSLTNNPVAHGNTPNILVVGDDDQAIFSFQGADVSNILSFRDHYKKTITIPLTDNYRSGENILETSRTIITQGTERLENYIDELDKTLTAHSKDPATVTIYEASIAADERAWLADVIANKIAGGVRPGDIAILARKHRELTELLPYLTQRNISVNYERRDNVFELEPVKLLIQLSRLITLLTEQRVIDADRLLPELLAHPAWGIPSSELWQLSMKAYDGRKRWIDTMETLSTFQPIHTWLTEITISAQTQPLEQMLDTLIGLPNEQETVYVSPFYEYFFSKEALENDPTLYVRYLEGLRTIRTSLRDHTVNETLTLRSFVSFVDLFSKTGSVLTSIHHPSESQTDAVNLMTAHKSKGLEFPVVFIVGAVENMWGERVRGKIPLISYPENLPLAKTGNTSDERLRLFFVAATRAKRELIISYSLTDDNGKSLDRANFLPATKPLIIDNHFLSDISSSESPAHWYTPILEPSSDLRQLLLPTLERYKLSATHLGNFLDITRGGPQSFLVHNLLRFPQTMSPSAAYGSAIHAVLQRTHAHLAATGKQRAIEDILHDYEAELSHHRLSELDFEVYSQKGIDALSAFLTAKYDSFSAKQKVELNFAGQQSIIDGAHLTGKLDLVDIDDKEKTMVVTDYKTGHPARSWKGTADYEKIKLHRYRQQLMFYKLLVENSRDFGSYSVDKGVLQFIEPTKDGQILSLEDDFSNTELDEFRALVSIVWGKITTLNLPDTTRYDPTHKGILAFEQDLIDGSI